ncbi:GTPase ObgE [Persicirhabdus sediminis]|uniref:GTPase Obg n=1 Tax=Persicirhabdus sediminis TaxID=454144 RepID=A0A8J7SKY8_9BACT|nr:GTPase ObgE [Persicirhabdus sediminis]MBK1791080.1 GTPase ObgE [Persicirhabdus sediminis]
MFVDHIRIYAQAGDGGNGIVHFRREKFRPKGGPDGGDGGDGGSVILEVSPHTDNLKAFAYDPKIIAKAGQHGMSQRKHGKNGKTVIAKVPPGTVIYRSTAQTVADAVDMERSEEGVDLEPIADLTEYGEQFILCEGGKGGKGNWHYKTSTNQAPEEHQLGTEGELGVFYFELRRIADAGLVGFPNAGKSTLLNKLSAASPKIGSYPFTTLNPSVGVCEFDNFRRCTIADIPGLIEGAHDNRGLGHEFLRHITRCRVLLFVVDMAGSEGRDPIDDLQILRKEIKMYDEELAQFEWMIIANKMDVEGAEENLAIFRDRFPKQTIIPISADQETGLEELKADLDERIGYRYNSKQAE